MATMMPVQPSLDGVLSSIRSRRAEIERERRLPRDLVDQLRATGIFSLPIPRAYGGREVEPATSMRVIEQIAAADGSTGWCAMIGIGNNGTAGYMPEAGAREVFADLSQPCAGLAAPAGAAVRVPGGVRVTGRWPFASGITHSQWVFAGCIVMVDGTPNMTPHGPEIIHVYMPVREISIHDTWFVSGLSGTGSQDFSAHDVFVPDHRIFRLLDPAEHRPEPLYQLPPIALFVSHLVAVGLGIARGALDELTELAQSRVPTFSTTVLAERAVAHLDVARAETRLASARAFLYDSIDELWRTVSAGNQPTPRQVALNRMAALNAAEAGADVTRTVNTLAGGSSVYVSSPLQRHMRDAEAITHHFTVAPHVWEDAGRVLLGRTPLAPVF